MRRQGRGCWRQESRRIADLLSVSTARDVVVSLQDVFQDLLLRQLSPLPSGSGEASQPRPFVAYPQTCSITPTADVWRSLISSALSLGSYDAVSVAAAQLSTARRLPRSCSIPSGPAYCLGPVRLTRHCDHSYALHRARPCRRPACRGRIVDRARPSQADKQFDGW
jgi:hypothetical protein